MRFHVLWLPTVGLAEPVKVPLLEAFDGGLTSHSEIKTRGRPEMWGSPKQNLVESMWMARCFCWEY